MMDRWSHGGVQVCGGNSSAVADDLSSGVTQIYSTWIVPSRRLKTMDRWSHGGIRLPADIAVPWPMTFKLRSDTDPLWTQSRFSNDTGGAFVFAALKADGSVVTWG